MAHRRTPSVIQTMKLSMQEENAEHVGINAAPVLPSAATALAPALPISSVRSSFNFDSMSTASSSTSSSPSSDDDCLSLSSLDLPNSPMTPGTPSKFFPHLPRFPGYIAEPPSRSALTEAQHGLRRFISYILAILSPTRVPGVLPFRSPHLSSSASTTCAQHSHLATLLTRPFGPLRRRLTFLALLILITLCTWTLFTSSLGDSHSLSRPYAGRALRNWKDWQNRVHGEGMERIRLMKSASFRAASASASTLDASTGLVRRPAVPQQEVSALLELTPSDELAALTAFIAALPWNALPSHVDPSTPLDPTIILDFDPSHPRARAELAALVKETWQLNPLVLFGKSQHPPTREVRTALEKLGVDMKNGVMGVDMAERVDRDIVLSVLGRLVSNLAPDTLNNVSTGNIELPLLIVGGRPIRGAEVLRMVESGEMARLVREVGAKMAAPSKKKKGGH